MSPAAFLEHTDGYLHSQLFDPPAAQRVRQRIAPFVTISREAGSGGSVFARQLVRKLNAEAPPEVTWRVFEGAIPEKMLAANALPRSFARFLPEDRVPEWSAAIGELVGLHPNLWDLTQKTNLVLRQLARTGHVVLVGRGSNFATRGLEGGVHVRLVASPEHRARFVAERYNVGMSEAAALNAKCEAARRRYVQAAFAQDVADPRAYDLILNMERLTFAAAVEMVCARLRAVTPPEAGLPPGTPA